MKPIHAVICLLMLMTANSAFANRVSNRVILLTGYWPPTNEMLREYSADPKVNPGTWKGKNWRNSGYDVYAYFPEFANKTDRVGTGPFRVDFAATFNDFQSLTQSLKPALILSFGHSVGPWEIETNFPAHYQQMFQSGKFPSTIGVEPNFPIPDDLKTNTPFRANLPFDAIMASVNGAQEPHLKARIDEQGDAGRIQCGFIGYLGGWYFEQHKNAPPAERIYGNGFIHVNGDLEAAKVSLEKTLEAIIPSLPTP